MTLPDGARVNGKRYVASIVRQALEFGKVTLANGQVMELSPDDVLSLLRWSFSQIDGPPKSETDITSGGEKIKVVVEYVSDDEGSESLPE